ncbi:copper chaperone PCu(A)C [Pseudomonas sp. JQ170]|uniref:copper chaperone PCu(A)C n=1 Tax=unclassified Pseudomonas TaxID=196821 RepID=UPI002652B664|nr:MULTISPECIES: copper chaperone PCu(A)C [unclassified Pseudomonas]MDN7139937.1 copper chaperone PCu(A)C [Pseudomonas sp. JQ170]WRO73615.1 copper chaperone PCu(A)C [Pseudomonas sp. 170C]
MNIKVLALTALMACAVPALAQEYKAGALLIEQPWSRELPAGLLGGAAYFTVHNTGSQADQLIGASSPRAQQSMIHAQSSSDGLMPMHHAPALTIPAHGEVTFQPGANHVMLTGMEQPLKAGEQFPLTLEFEHAGKVEVLVKVQPADTQASHGDHSAHSAGMAHP